MKFGVPLVPLLAIVLPGMVLGIWLTVLVAWPFAPLTFLAMAASVFWMRRVTHLDDQRLMQMVLKVKLRLRNRNSAWRHGARVYTPIAFRRSIHVWRR